MKLYIVYFRTMQDSPEVTIECATTNEAVAEKAYLKAKADEDDWMEDLDEDDSDWAEACMETFDVPGEPKPGDVAYVSIVTEWMEAVDTRVYVHLDKAGAEAVIEEERKNLLEEYDDLQPYDGTDEDHLEDPSVAVDVYFSIEDVKIQ